VARSRDLAAEARERAAEAQERALGIPNTDVARTRAEAAADRARAAEDRARAAEDRHQAAWDRQAAQAELEKTQLDDLTGFYRRGLGKAILQKEIDRSRRSNGRLVLASIDVDGLDQGSDEDGHSSDDLALEQVASAIRSRLRSFDPVVRLDGHTFACVVSGSDLDAARKVFKDIQEALVAGEQRTPISVGLAALRTDDSLETLMARGVAARH